MEVTTKLSREEILGAYASVATAPAAWWREEPKSSEAAADATPAHRWEWPDVSPWLIGCGVLAGLAVALVLWYVLPVETNRLGLWQPQSMTRYAPPVEAVAVAQPTSAPILKVEATPVPTTQPTPQPQTLAPVVLGETVPPVMVVVCDGQPYALRTVGDLGRLVRWRGASWPHGCHTDTDWWSVERQAAWQNAHR